MTLKLRLPGGHVSHPPLPGQGAAGESRTIAVGSYRTPHSVVAAITAEIDARRDKLFSAEGERRLRRDIGFLLYDGGKIRIEQFRAIGEIAEVFAAITRSLQPKLSATYGERLPGGCEADLPPMLKAAMVERYAPWREWAGATKAGSRANLADLTLLVAVDNLGMEQVGNRLGMNRRSVLRDLQRSLWQYALIGDWVRESREVA
ncbi:hypothetical protein ACI2KH_22135 [Roseomonas mucosa]|uniref:hypothetical protein n=1 Tax=Roseomonas mucosa TaxID=207340 RepID=UPI00384FC67F